MNRWQKLAMALWIFCAAAPPAAAATDVRWQASGGTLSGPWNDTGRWGGGNVPDTSGENAVIDAAAGAPYVVTLTGAMYPAGLDANRVYVGSPQATLAASGVTLRLTDPEWALRGYGNNARIDIAGGSITTTGIHLSQGTIAQPVQLTLANAQLSAGGLWMSEGSRLSINGASSGSIGTGGTSWLLSSSQLDLNGGTIAFGDLRIGGSVWDQKTTCRIRGANVTATALLMNLTGSALYTAPALEVTAGSFTAQSAVIGTKNYNLATDRYLLRVAGGSLTFHGTVNLGASDYCRATLQIDGGTFAAQHLHVGSMDARGEYVQENGTATISGTLTLYTQTYNVNGTRRFVVGRGSTLKLTGAVFAKFGSSAWLTDLLAPGNLDFSGTLVFEPASTVAEQQLLAFGQDRGAAATAANDNYAIGVLDVTQLVAAQKRLRVTAAGNHTQPALYVRSLRGFGPGTTAATVASVFTGTNLKIYYDPAESPNLSGTYAFGTNSQLIPLDAPVVPAIQLTSLGNPVHAARLRAATVTPKVNAPGQHWAVVHYANDWDKTAGWYRVDLNGADHAFLTPNPLRPMNQFNNHYREGQIWANNGRLFYMMEELQIQYFDPVDGQVHDLPAAALPQFHPTAQPHGYYYLYKGIVGRDKRVYIGASTPEHAPLGKVAFVVIDPDTLAVTQIRDVTPAGGYPPRESTLTYPSYFAANPPWLYAVLGQSQWDLVAIDMRSLDGQNRPQVVNNLIHLEPDEPGLIQVMDHDSIAPRVEFIRYQRPFSEIASAGAQPYDNGNGPVAGWWYRGNTLWTADGSGTFTRKDFLWCVNGQIYANDHPFNTATGDPLPSPLPAYPAAADVVQFRNTQEMSWPESSRPELDRLGVEKAVRNAQGQWTHTLKSRLPGATTWTTSTYAIDAVVRPVPIGRLLALTDGTLLGEAVRYQGFFRYRPGSPFVQYGAASMSKVQFYQADDGNVLLAGYPSSTLMLFDPRRAYDAAFQDWITPNPSRHPFKLGGWGHANIAGAHYVFGLLPDGRGRTYMTGQGDRDNYNSAVGYYDLPSGTFKGKVTPDMQHLHAISILVRRGASADADRLIYSGYVWDNQNIPGGPPLTASPLRIFDRELNELATWTVKPYLLGTGYIYDGAASQAEELIGVITESAWIPADQRPILGNFALYRFNTTTRQTVDWRPHAKKLSELVKKTPDDGYYYAVQYDAVGGDTLLRVHPEDLSVTPVAKFAPGASPWPLTWFAGHWYGAIGTQLYRLDGVP